MAARGLFRQLPALLFNMLVAVEVEPRLLILRVLVLLVAVTAGLQLPGVTV
jgi:hypothetical protein